MPLANERINFVKTSLNILSSSYVIKIYLIATGVQKKELQHYMPTEKFSEINDDVLLSCYATCDADGNRYFFYENWFYDYSFERSMLFQVEQWPVFTRHWINIENNNISGVNLEQDDRPTPI